LETHQLLLEVLRYSQSDHCTDRWWCMHLCPGSVTWCVWALADCIWVETTDTDDDPTVKQQTITYSWIYSRHFIHILQVYIVSSHSGLTWQH